MTLAIKHNFVTAKTDGSDASLLRPSNWNDTHAITLATNNLIGRASAGAGAAEEIPTSAAVIALLASADLPTFLAALGISPATTGDGRITLKTTAPAGWVIMNDLAIGNAGSSANGRANIDCLALFTLLYNNVSDANAGLYTVGGVLTTRASQGAAATAWGAGCSVMLPRQLGRAIVGAGTGAGLTARALGSNFGEEAHLLAIGEVPSHYHAANMYDPGHVHAVTGGIYGSANTSLNYYQGGSQGGSPAAVTISGALTGVRVNAGNGLDLTGSAGGGATHNITQASAAWNVMVKL
jgi:microcystin-dependent protein